MCTKDARSIGSVHLSASGHGDHDDSDGCDCSGTNGFLAKVVGVAFPATVKDFLHQDAPPRSTAEDN
uniref:Uncharacterized protein n=1 Tax=Arundo donax TaxID=35708 RepID=A0A0A8YRC7_ARUDO